VDLLLEAIANLDERFSAVIVGYGAEHARLSNLAKQLGVEDRVSWLGAMPHEQAVREIARFDIAVLPGTPPTATPIKLFEYAALARPIVAPDFPNLRAWFTADEMRFVPPQESETLAQAILEMAEAPDEARRLGKNAQTRTRAYTWEEIMGQLITAVGLEQHRDEG